MSAKPNVVRSGALTTVQDSGRHGHAHLGVPRSGAVDAPAMRLANRLLGNDPDAAVLEITPTGCALRPDQGVTVVVGGAPCPVTVDGLPVAWGAPVRVPADAVLNVGAATAGVRSYVAVAGGIAVEPVLGSRSTDLLSGLGPTPVRDGDVLPLGAPARQPALPLAAPWNAPPAALVLPIRPGPRTDWFTPAALRTLASATYRVSPHGNRIGMRTEGPPLERRSTGGLPSEGMVLGAVQVSRTGAPWCSSTTTRRQAATGDRSGRGSRPRPGAAQACAGTPVRFALG